MLKEHRERTRNPVSVTIDSNISSSKVGIGSSCKNDVVSGIGTGTKSYNKIGGLKSGVCAACSLYIEDRFYLLAVDKQWHLSCLRCHQCNLPLQTQLTCYSRHGNIYCKEDYYRLFPMKQCSRCHRGISSKELVMRAREHVYHVSCFICASCGIKLDKGDHFGMRDGLIYCRPHYDIMRHKDYFGPVELGEFPMSPPSQHRTSLPLYWNNQSLIHPDSTTQKGRPRKHQKSTGDEELPSDMSLIKTPQLIHSAPSPAILSSRVHSLLCMDMLQSNDLSSSIESLSYDSGNSCSNASTAAIQNAVHQLQTSRSKRMRTSFKHHQLRTMKSYFNINQNPDAKDLKQLAQKTGLSKRVLQVWFQNARAKWRRNVMRQDNGAGQSANVIGLLPPPRSSSVNSRRLSDDQNNASANNIHLMATANALEEFHQRRHLHPATQLSVQFDRMY